MKHAARIVAMALPAVLLGACSAPDAVVVRTPLDISLDEGTFASIRTQAERKLANRLARGGKPTDSPGEAEQFFLDQRLSADVPDYPVARVQETLAEMRAREAERARLRMPPAGGITGWSEAGPGNIGGRTRTIVIDPVTPTTMYGAGVAGGVWKSADAGLSWTPTDDFMANIRVSTIAMDPTDPSVLYAGTGEGVFASPPRGLGIFKSTDAGATWTHLPSTANSGFYYVNKIRISPGDPQRLYAGTRHGVWRSTDGGGTWDLVLRNPTYVVGAEPATNGCIVGCLDLDVRSDRDPDVIFASFGNFQPDGLFRSDDGGDTWTGQTFAPNQGRMTLDIAPSNNDVIYISMADNGSTGNTLGAIVDVYRSADGGATWQPRVDLATPFGPWLLGISVVANGCIAAAPYHQGWFDNVIAVDPLDEDIVWIGGVEIFRSDDGGVTWGIAGHWIFNFLTPRPPEYIHADMHEIVFHPDYDGVTNQTMYVGNDGGIYRTFNARAETSQDFCPISPPVDLPEVQWAALNNSYGVTQFYHGDIASGGDILAGGAQDVGTALGTPGAPNGWARILGGDGGYVAFDPTNDDIIYAESQFFPNIAKSTDGGQTFFSAVAGITDSDGLFITPFAMDPSDPLVLWSGGQRPWRTTNGAASWQLAGPNIPGGTQISAIAVAPADGNVVYLGFANGWVARSTNGLSASPSFKIRSGGLPIGGWVSSVAVDPADPDTAYCTYSTFDIDHVFTTTDGGQSWTPIDSISVQGIPDIPAHWIAVRPCNRDQLYVGTELGVFASDDRGLTWEPANAGLANTMVEALTFKDDDTLAAFTFGRGAFVASLEPCTSPCPADLDGNGVLNVDDIDAFVAAFLGGLPAADCDGTGALNVDDVDCFVAAFLGGCP